MAKAATGSGKNITPNREMTASWPASPKSYVWASATSQVMPWTSADSRAVSIITGERSEPVTWPVAADDTSGLRRRRARAAPDVQHRLTRLQVRGGEQLRADRGHLPLALPGTDDPATDPLVVVPARRLLRVVVGHAAIVSPAHFSLSLGIRASRTSCNQCRKQDPERQRVVLRGGQVQSCPVIAVLAYVVMALSGAMVVWGLVTAAVDKPPGRAQLLFAAGVEVVTVVQTIVAFVVLAQGFRPVELATTIGYLIGIVVLIPVAWFWANVERTRFSGVVLAVAGLAVAVMTLRLLQLWIPAG